MRSLIIPEFLKIFFFFRIAFLTEITENREESLTWEEKTEKRVILSLFLVFVSFLYATAGLEQKNHCINTLPHKNNRHACSSGKRTEVRNILLSKLLSKCGRGICSSQKADACLNVHLSYCFLYFACLYWYINFFVLS